MEPNERDVTDPDVELTEEEIEALTDEQVAARFSRAAAHVTMGGVS